MININNVPHILEFQDDPLRRELKGQLLQFRDLIKNYNHPDNDIKTIELKKWLEDFTSELNGNPNTAAIQTKYLDRLKKILVEPIIDNPLTEEAYLGNDGHTYEKKTLILFLKNAYTQDTKDYRSPVFLDSPQRFIISLHPLVPVIFKWLKEKQDFELPSTTSDAYNLILQSGNLPYFPTLENEQKREKVIQLNEKMRLMKQRLALQQEQDQLFATLIEIENLFEIHALDDSTTNEIKEWHRLFKASLETTEDFLDTKSTFLDYLQELLVDPIYLSPLEEEAFLGSDGLTYSKKCLTLYLSSVAEPYSFRSPKDPEKRAIFSVKPHPTASPLVKWLKGMNRPSSTPEIDQLYLELSAQGKLKELPTEENLHILALNREFEEQELAFDAIVREEKEKLQVILENVKRSFNGLDEQIEENEEMYLKALKQLKKTDAKDLSAILKAINEMDKEQTHILNRSRAFENDIHKLESKIQSVYQMNAQLSQSIEQTRAAIKKRNSGFWGSVLNVISIVGAFYGAHIILQAVSGGVMSAAPSTTRFMIKAAIKF
jgi:hypothetical protein